MVDSGRGGGGGRMHYRPSASDGNNPNMMYQDECERRMRSANKDSRSSFSRDGRSRDSDRSSLSSYRDRSREGRSSYGSGSDQYQSFGRSGGQSSGSSGVNGGMQDQSVVAQGQFGPPPPGGPQPLMAQQFAPLQPPLMSFIGQPPFPFVAPPPPSAPRK